MCACDDPTPAEAFADIVKAETRLNVKLSDLWVSHRGWLSPAFDDALQPHLGRLNIREMGVSGTTGVYLLWALDGYCDVHANEIYRAVYAGKSGTAVQLRLLTHQGRASHVGNTLGVHVTAWPAQNRVAKYVEQVLLDVFDFEANTYENPGRLELLIGVPQSAWD